ncbi:MAG: biopolymer transporter ExbD [Planctomycetota bacterium]|jgi:biopolymer transport protein ExbD|nr:biopolymer transporter ExbD [Planctomycetia bacterium]RLT05341.1 MAG: biopolymer transporter ExbD [Planctomycetota bacterium]
MGRKQESEVSSTDIDMTPMIDMTFQLITFFMFVMNFSEAEQDDRIQLPSSQLAKPVEGAMESPITLQLTNKGSIVYAGEEVAVADIGAYLEREKTVMLESGKEPNAATVIVRADGRSKTGEVQKIIQTCQEKGFERFALRAQYDEGQ